MCATVLKRTVTPSLQKHKDRGRMQTGETRDGQFEGLQIQRLPNSKLHYRLGTSEERKPKMGYKQAPQLQARGQMFQFQSRPKAIVSPPKAPSASIHWSQQQSQSSAGPAKSTELHPTILQLDAMHMFQNQHTLFPYKKAQCGPAIDVNKTRANDRLGLYQGQPQNEIPPLAVGYARQTAYNNVKEQPPSAVFAYAKLKSSRKPVAATSQVPQSPKRPLDSGAVTEEAVPMSSNAIMSVGHNITHLRRHKEAVEDAGGESLRRGKNEHLSQVYSYLYPPQQDILAIGSMMLPQSVTRTKPKQKQKATKTRTPYVTQESVQSAKEVDLRILQALLKSGNLPQFYVVPSVIPVYAGKSQVVQTQQQEMAALSISKKPQFTKAGACRSGSISSSVPFPVQICRSQVLNGSDSGNEVQELGEGNPLEPIAEPPQPSSAEKTRARAAELASYMAAMASNKYKFVVTRGNNSQLVKRVLEATRPWWVELPSTSLAFNFKWQPTSYGLKYDSLNATGIKQIVNHFEMHPELSRKSSLFINLQTYSEVLLNILTTRAQINKENVFNFVPITFYVEINPQKPSGQLASAIHNFEVFYKVLEENRSYISSVHADPQLLQSPPKPAGKAVLKLEKPPTRLLPVAYDKRGSPQYTRYAMPLCHFAGHNLWLLKPTCLNRGRGIHVFRDLENLKELIVKYCQTNPEDQHATEGTGGSPGRGDAKDLGKKKDKEKDPITMPNTFIIQKYIERPLLIHGRKFDIRVWVLLTHELDCYFFREGYLRTSSSEYKIDLSNVDDKFVHLTNNAVQQFSGTYGSFEDGNQMSFQKFQKYLDEHCADKGVKMEQDILPQIKNLIKKSILAVRKKIDTESRKYSLELFGYDFIIDEDFNVWLIEVNTNPCIEESSELLKMLLPRMISDAFKLTLDVIFPPLQQHVTGTLKRYSVTGYADDFNMWELMCGTTDHSIQIAPPPTILRSANAISVNDDRKVSVAKPKTPKKAAAVAGSPAKAQSPQKKKSAPECKKTAESETAPIPPTINPGSDSGSSTGPDKDKKDV